MITSFFEYRVVIVEKDLLLLSVGQVSRNYFSHSLVITIVRAKEYPVFAQAFYRKIHHTFFIVAPSHVDVYLGERPECLAHILPVAAPTDVGELKNGFGKSFRCFCKIFRDRNSRWSSNVVFHTISPYADLSLSVYKNNHIETGEFFYNGVVHRIVDFGLIVQSATHHSPFHAPIDFF